MGKRNLLVNRLCLVGVSKAERIDSNAAADEKFYENHRSLRKEYHVLAPQGSAAIGKEKYYLDFFRAAGARYWSFKSGLTPSDYNDFGYLNAAAEYIGLEPTEIEIENMNINNEENCIGFRIGDKFSDGTGQLVTSDLNRHNGSDPAAEWLHPEVGPTAQDTAGAGGSVPLVGSSNAPWNLLVSNDAGLNEAGDVQPLSGKHWFGAPLFPNNASASMPASYYHYTPPPAPEVNYTRTMTNLSRKELINIKPGETSWRRGATLGGLAPASDFYKLKTRPENWARYWGINSQPSTPNATVPSNGFWTSLSAAPGDWKAWCDNQGVAHPQEWLNWRGITSHDAIWQKETADYAGPAFFKDHAHEFKTPYGINEPINKLGGVAIKTAKIEPKYNYLAKSYELAIAKTGSDNAAVYDERLLPNAYMIYNHIDYTGPEAEVEEIDISDKMRTTYKRVNCLWGQFDLPSSYLQINQTGYGPTETSYLRKFAATDVPSDWRGRRIKWLNSHIGFSKEMMESDFIRYEDYESFPFGITIEFDTDLIGEKHDLMDKLHDLELGSGTGGTAGRRGTIDFITNNIILMNLSRYNSVPGTDGIAGTNDDWSYGWSLSACAGIPRDCFTEKIQFCTQVTEQVPGSMVGVATAGGGSWAQAGQEWGTIDPSEFVAYNTYYGFDWVRDANGQPTSWGPNNEFANSTGRESFRCLDVAKMLNYANVSIKTPRYVPTESQYAVVSNADGDSATTTWTTPSPVVGQSEQAGIARQKGILVGPKGMNSGGRINNGSFATGFTNNARAGNAPGPKQASDNADYKTVHAALSPPSHTQGTNSALDNIFQAFADVIQEKSRSYLQMINGKLAYTETLAFKVDKHKIATDGTETVAIQSFYFPNTKSLNKIKYVDTQVKYGTKYKYKVYAYNLVIGNEYCYQNIPACAIGTDKSFYAHQFVSAKIIETPYFEFATAEVRDLPPVFPEVEIVPFKGINNKIRFLMQTQNVKYSFIPEKFIINDVEDRERYRLQRDFQQRLAKDSADQYTEPIVFGSDDTEITFEIYRRTEKPTSYADFAGAPHATVEGLIPGTEGQRAMGLGWDDNIEPNTKYYYTIRCTDYHGGLSVPSPIYQVEIVDDNGRMFPIVEVFYISNHVDVINRPSKSLRKYLHVGAAFAQKIIPDTIVNAPAAEALDLNPATNGHGLVLGANQAAESTGGESAWSGLWGAAYDANNTNKTAFKIRLTSKSTGKKLDLNVRLEERPVINPDEQS